MIKHTFNLMFAFLLCAGANAQSLERSVVSTSGDFFSNSTMSIAYTIGESAIGFFTNGSLSITQGFNQSQLDTQSSSVWNVIPSIDIQFYPNPANDNLTVQSSEKLNIQVVDILGKKVSEVSEIQPQIPANISVSHLATGIYFLRVEDEKNRVSTVKWMKN